jgi:BlaI family transcriptional regulator, penicillinase repressor
MSSILPKLSRRERQIMDVLFRKQRATAAEILEAIPDAPGYSAIRALLRILEDKGHIRHESDGARYVYLPAVPVEKAKHSAIRHLLDTFFEGNVENAVATLIDDKSRQLSREELDRIGKLIEEARKRQ